MEHPAFNKALALAQWLYTPVTDIFGTLKTNGAPVPLILGLVIIGFALFAIAAVIAIPDLSGKGPLDLSGYRNHLRSAFKKIVWVFLAYVILAAVPIPLAFYWDAVCDIARGVLAVCNFEMPRISIVSPFVVFIPLALAWFGWKKLEAY